MTDRLLRLATYVTVGYQTDVDSVLRLLEEVTAKVARVSEDPAPQAFLLKFGADGLELEIGFWISDPENGRLGVLSDVNKSIWHALQAHQINVPYPQREVRLIDDRVKNEDSEKTIMSRSRPAADKP